VTAARRGVDAAAEIVQIQKSSNIFRLVSDVYLVVVGNEDDNQLIIAAVLTTWVDALTTLLKSSL
jgi:hypothetical protein